VPAGGVYKIAPVTLPSDRVLFLEEGSSLVGSDRWQDYGVTRFLPPMGTEQQLRPLLSGTCLQTRSTPAPILIPSAKLLVALQRLICGHMLPLPPRAPACSCECFQHYDHGRERHDRRQRLVRVRRPPTFPSALFAPCAAAACVTGQAAGWWGEAQWCMRVIHSCCDCAAVPLRARDADGPR
jgi:hypothetical protein